MIYGSEPTKALHDRGRAPKESFPLVYAICTDERHCGAKGRTRLRKLLGPEHEKSDLDIPGMRGFPVWRYVLKDETAIEAPQGFDAAGLPTIYILGPTAKTFMTIEASKATTGPEAAKILSHLVDLLAIRI